MTGIILGRERAGREMTADATFSTRVVRLVAVSSVALGVIFWLVFDAMDGRWGAAALVGIGWLSMPTVLAASLVRPAVRYLLVLPATSASVGVLATALMHDGYGMAVAGWWLLTAGLWFGAALGSWFWFRWAPVPAKLDQPFSSARWTLIGVHVALVVFGVLLVIGSRVL